MVEITLFEFFFVAIDTAKLWIIDRSVFQMIMMRTGMMRQAEHIAFLKRYTECMETSNHVYFKTPHGNISDGSTFEAVTGL